MIDKIKFVGMETNFKDLEEAQIILTKFIVCQGKKERFGRVTFQSSSKQKWFNMEKGTEEWANFLHSTER